MWKKLFFGLLTFNVLVVATLLSFLFRPSTAPIISTNKKEGVELTIETTKQHVNTLIQQYTAKKAKATAILYDVLLSDRVYVTSYVSAFGRRINFMIAFDPIVNKSGHIELIHPTITIGQLHLPVTYVLAYARQELSLPKWVAIDPKNERVHLILSEIDIKKGWTLYAKSFDLKNDRIAFQLIMEK